ncbi:hypothetical protein [Planktotalea sp.]|uniref:hypothetical protein n=1 Tax=Planktotalea sp. TaxID=2029877 RepID=UPI0025D87885|nr:hypothetical protein [Planktotalea sp.]
MFRKLFISSGGAEFEASVALHTHKGMMNFALGRMGRFMPAISFDQPAMYLRDHKTSMEIAKVLMRPNPIWNYATVRASR